MSYILNRQLVADLANLGALIEFVVDGVELKRRLVVTKAKMNEISIASPVGVRLANAKPGDQFVIPMKEPEPAVVVLVVNVLCEASESSVAPAVA